MRSRVKTAAGRDQVLKNIMFLSLFPKVLFKISLGFWAYKEAPFYVIIELLSLLVVLSSRKMLDSNQESRNPVTTYYSSHFMCMLM